MKANRKYILLFGIIAVVLVAGIAICFSQMNKGNWDIAYYETLDDIYSIKEVENDKVEGVRTYKIMYKSDDCIVASYLSIPDGCLENREKRPCIIYNRGGNRARLGVLAPSEPATVSAKLNTIVFASQYRGVDGGTGKDEFGGAELQDVIKLIDLCEEFSFVDMDEIYMWGGSRGGMMTYMAIRQDTRIKKAVVSSGLADAFMNYAERPDMKEVYLSCVGGTPEQMPEEYEKRSVTYWADELKCPVLIIHSKGDPRVSYAQVEKLVQCLEDAGKEYKLVTYEDDLHESHPEDWEIIREWIS